MAYIDVFNGDADGLCALHQLRLADPQNSTLITGVKRDIDLVKQVQAIKRGLPSPFWMCHLTRIAMR